jgi:hypothetical protein
MPVLIPTDYNPYRKCFKQEQEKTKKPGQQARLMKTSARATAVKAEIQIQHLPNTNLEH